MFARHADRDMFTADEFVIRRIEAAPSGAGDVDLRPGVSGAMLAFGHWT